MDEDVLKKARELLREPEMIIDLYDLTIIWMGDSLKKLTGFINDELIGTTIMNEFAPSEKDKRAKAMEHMSKSHGFMDVALKRKGGGSLKFNVEFYTFELKGGFFHAGKSLKHTKVPAPGRSSY